jgi:SAM-dependent methyltransferase
MKNFKSLLISIYKIMREFGLDPIQFFRSLIGIPYYLADFIILLKQKGSDKNFKFGNIYPILTERFVESGTMSGHYFHQDLFVARQIYLNKPSRHIDIGSRTDGFVAHVAVFREIEIIDIRDQHSKVKNVKFKRADLMRLPKDLVNSSDSISCLHSIEHFGLGRYGDPINYEGYTFAIENIHKILKKKGKFYFSTVIGTQRIEFNAHRVFSINYLIDLLKDKFEINSFSYINDAGDFFEDVEMNEKDINSNYGCEFGCGIFILTKK